MALWRNDKVDVNFKCRTINPITAHVRALHRFVFYFILNVNNCVYNFGGGGCK